MMDDGQVDGWMTDEWNGWEDDGWMDGWIEDA